MKEKKENGTIMLESLIVYLVTIMLLFFILAVFSLLYQRWNIQTIANETAARVAQTYRFSNADTDTGEIAKKDIGEIRQYRYLYNSVELEKAAKRRVESYFSDRLSKTSYTKQSSPNLSVYVIHDSLASRHIEVVIDGSYQVPFNEFLSYFGFKKLTTYKVTAYAECVDLSDYINTIDYVDNQSSLKQFNSSFVKMVDKILSLFDNIFY